MTNRYLGGQLVESVGLTDPASFETVKMANSATRLSF